MKKVNFMFKKKKKKKTIYGLWWLYFYFIIIVSKNYLHGTKRKIMDKLFLIVLFFLTESKR